MAPEVVQVLRGARLLYMAGAALVLATGVVGYAAPGFSAEVPQPVQTAVRDRGAGGVTVSATWLGVRDDRLAFRLSLDTHSVDLSGFDVLANTALRAGSGQELRPVRWQEERTSSHHRAGVVYFPLPRSLQGGLVVVVRNLAGVDERELMFEFRR